MAAWARSNSAAKCGGAASRGRVASGRSSSWRRRSMSSGLQPRARNTDCRVGVVWRPGRTCSLSVR
eukprot:11207487-Lingulodinium_polyedra.AAC.1